LLTLTLVSTAKMVAEIALLSLAGQWLLGLLAGNKRSSNLFYQVLSIMTRPFVRVARAISPSLVLDRHVPLVTFLMLSFVWLICLLAKVRICVQVGMEMCR
jgi:hypothetical protein